jgi:hypothetical protein
LERLCRDWFNLKVISVSLLKDEPVPFDFYLAVQTREPEAYETNRLPLSKSLQGVEYRVR